MSSRLTDGVTAPLTRLLKEASPALAAVVLVAAGAVLPAAPNEEELASRGAGAPQ